MRAGQGNSSRLGLVLDSVDESFPAATDDELRYISTSTANLAQRSVREDKTPNNFYM